MVGSPLLSILCDYFYFVKKNQKFGSQIEIHLNYLKQLNMEFSGKPTLHPVMFIAAKVTGYFTWLMLVLALSGVSGLRYPGGYWLEIFVFMTLIIGIVYILVSSFTLGKSIRIGLPVRETTLKIHGIYRFSRNPMYIGVHLITLSAMLLTLKWWVILPGLFSIYAYHLITLAEEHFLENRFGESYHRYKQKTRRYF